MSFKISTSRGCQRLELLRASLPLQLPEQVCPLRSGRVVNLIPQTAQNLKVQFGRRDILRIV
jgi:hypothetical protein